MNEREILKHIDDGANFYISLFGRADHMEVIERPHYSYIHPASEEYGIRFVYNVHVDGLPAVQRDAVIAEIKALNMPVWVDLLSSDDVFFAFFGRKKVHGQTAFGENDEVYMAMLPRQQQKSNGLNPEVALVSTPEEFARWAEINNRAFANGNPDMHPVYHYPLCVNGLMKCYIRYHEGSPAAIAAIMDNNGITSLEFVATVPEMQRKGFAKDVCERAIYDAFENGAKIVTVRAINAAAAKLYKKVGFTAYNHAI